MLSTSKLKQPDDPHDVLVVAPDVALVVPTDEELSKLAHTLRHPSAPQIRTGSEPPAGATVPPVDATFRPAVSDVRVPGPRRAARVFTTALLLAGCAGAAAFAWQSYGDAARQMIGQWTPQRILTSLLPLEKSGPPRNRPHLPRRRSRRMQHLRNRQCSGRTATGNSGSGRTASHRAERCRPISRICTVAFCDGARPRKCGTGDQAAQGQHRTAQGQYRAAHGWPATNIPRHRQGFGAEPAAEDFTAPAAAGRGTGAQAAATFATAGDASSDVDASCRALHTTATRTAAARHGYG